MHRNQAKDQSHEEPDAGKPHVRICEGRTTARGASTRPRNFFTDVFSTYRRRDGRLIGTIMAVRNACTNLK